MLNRIASRNRTRGFTLVELAIVIAIVGVLSAIAIPRFAMATSRYRVAAIARRISADITMTRNRARALSTSQSITFSTAANNYQITGMSDPDHAASTYTVSLNDASLPGQLVSTVFGTGATLTFNGYGVPSCGGTIQISSGTASATITVDPDTGRCVIQ